MVGGIDDPENGPEVAATVFIAVLVYAVCVLLASVACTARTTPLSYFADVVPFLSRASLCSAVSKACCTCAKTGEERLRCRTDACTDGWSRESLGAEAEAEAGAGAEAGTGAGTMLGGSGEHSRRHPPQGNFPRGPRRPERGARIVTSPAESGQPEPVHA